MKKEKSIYLEALRILACYLVIYNHTEGYHCFLTEAYSYKMWCHLFFTMLTRINVPVFFMISGSLLLGKEESLKQLYTKRIGKICLIVFAASFAVYIKTTMFSGVPFSIREFFQKFLSGNIDGSYWYLYAYIAGLVMLPFLRAIVRHLKFADYVYLFIVHGVLCSILPVVFSFLPGFSLTGSFEAPLATTKCIFYMLIGYAADKKYDVRRLNTRKIAGMFGCMVFCIFIESALTIYHGMNSGFSQDYVQIFDYVLAVFAFVLVKYFFSGHRIDSRAEAVLACGGG